MDKKELYQYELLYFQNDEPCPLKLKCGYELLINPIKVRDWTVYDNSLDILQIDKNSINNIDIIKMSYLEFLATNILPNDERSQALLYNLFHMSCGISDIAIIKEDRYKVVLLDDDEKVVAFLTPKEFDKFANIVLFQNIKGYDDRIVDQDVKELMRDYYKIKYKNSKTPTLEEQKTYVIGKTGMSMATINDMTYRTFSQVYKHCVDDIIYIGQKIIQGSFKYDVKEEILHPLYTPERDAYSELFEDTSVLGSKGISGVEQLNGLNMSE